MLIAKFKIWTQRWGHSISRPAFYIKHASLLGTIALLVLAMILVPGPGVWNSQQLTRDNLAGTADTRESVIPQFRDITLESGVVFSHLQGDEFLTGLNETLGSGACAFDYDNDGWVDLFLVNGTGQTKYYGSQHWWSLPKGNALFHNIGYGRFEEVTSSAGLREQSWGMGCVNGDFDNDGNQDLLVTNFGSIQLYRNNGNGTFTDVSKESGIAADGWSTSATLADIDGDGLLDIYITTFIDFAKGAHTYEATTQFAGEYPRAFNSQLYAGAANHLYRNTGHLHFEEITEQAGVRDISGRGLSSIWFDANGDSKPDLFVANDIGTTNVLFVNQGKSTFEEQGLKFLLNDAHGAHGVSMGDINNDGAPDFAISGPTGEPPAVLMNEREENGTGQIFRNRSRQLGVGEDTETPFGGWGIALEDFNNDGLLDLFQASGLLVPDANTRKIPTGQPKRLWLQQHDGRFRNVSEEAGIALTDAQSARGIAVADYDNDGNVDIYVAHNNDMGQLLHNDNNAGHWLGLQLVGTRGNRDAIGANVKLETNGVTQYRFLTSGGFLSNNDRRLHFGWNGDDAKITLTVTWPGGNHDVYRDLPIDQYVRIVEGKSRVEPIRFDKVQRDVAPQLGLQLANERTANRKQYLKWVVGYYGTLKSLNDLRAALHDRDVGVQLLAIDILKTDKQAAGLELLIAALTDAHVEVRLAALDAVRDHEDEGSIRWLLRAFNDPDPQMRAAVAEVFAYFYRKEEAVIYRKYLALPHLIKLLDDPEPLVRRAAAHAIGEAKRFEGIDPLVAHLRDVSPAVRAEAACSLGLIRDRKALEFVRKVFADDQQQPSTRAQALIALKRLGDIDDRQLSQLFFTNSAFGTPPSPYDGIRIIAEIFSSSLQGSVLNRSTLITVLNRLTQNIELKPLEYRLSAIAALDLSGHDGIATLRALSFDHDATVRKQAIETLINIDRSHRESYFSRALLDKDLGLREYFIKRLEKEPAAVDLNSLMANLDIGPTRTAAMRLLARVQSPSAMQRLYQIASNEKEDTETRVIAVGALTTSKLAMPTQPIDLLIQSLLKNSKPQLRESGLRLWAASLPYHIDSADIPVPLQQALSDANRDVQFAGIDVLLGRHEAWAIRFLCNSLADVRTDLGIRRRILDGFASGNVTAERQLLVQIAASHSDALRVPSLSAIDPVADGNAHHLLSQLLINPAENQDLRFGAAQKLFASDAESVINILQAK